MAGELIETVVRSITRSLGLIKSLEDGDPHANLQMIYDTNKDALLVM